VGTEDGGGMAASRHRAARHPDVVAPTPLVTFLTIGSCLLLVWSGLGLRRLEAERESRRPPTLGT
jgi:hypothetical protein